MWDLIKTSIRDFIAHQCPQRAAALAYYTIFALPPTLLIVIAAAGLVFGEDAARGELDEQLRSLVGPGVADQVKEMLMNVNRPGSKNIAATLAGIAGLLFGATAAFAQLQRSLNDVWEVDPRKGVKNFMLKRGISFLLVLFLALLMMASMMLSTLLMAFNDGFSQWVTFPGMKLLFEGVNALIALALITFFIAMVFKIIPDRDLRWRQVWAGALFTAVLIVAGKFVIGLYMGMRNPGSAFGAAGSLAVLLVWVYYTALMFFLGAEFTHHWALRHDPPDPEMDEAEADDILTRL